MTIAAVHPTNYQVFITLTLTALADGTTTQSVVLTGVDNETSTGWPILLSIPELGYEMDGIMPRETSASFQVDNSIGSIGNERKFSDLLQTYEIVDQPVSVDISQFTGDTWTGTVASVSDAPGSGGSILNIEIKSKPITDKIVTLAINPELTDFADAPEQSVGKHLPIVAGAAVPTVGYLISASTETTKRYAYATNLADAHTASESSWWLEDVDGNWINLTATADTVDSYATTAAEFTFGTTLVERGFGLVASGGNALLTGFKFGMFANGTTSRVSTMQLTATVYEAQLANPYKVLRTLSTGIINCVDYDTENNVGGADKFWIECVLDRPVVTDHVNRAYCVTLKATDFTAGDMSWIITTTNTDRRRYTRNTSTTAGAGGFDFQIALGSEGVTHQVVATLSDGASATANSEGQTFSYVDIADSQSNVIADLNPMFSVTGPHTKPSDLIQMLSKEWDGNSWEASAEWDFTTYASDYTTAYAASGDWTRQAKGQTDGQTTLLDCVRGICADMCSSIAVNNAGVLFLYPWGLTRTSVTTIPASEILPISWEILDGSTVINRVKLSYLETRKGRKFDINVQGERITPNFEKMLDRSVPVRSGYDSATISKAIYGSKELQETQTQWVGTDTAAYTLCDSYLCRYPFAKVRAVFAVDMDKYFNLKQTDVIQFGSPAFPQYAGAWTDMYDTSGSCAVYRGQIEGWTRVLSSEQVPRLRLVVNVLRNNPKDPT